MLVSLAIRDVVLIDRLTLGFQSGLCVLTGETGAGKSILLDSLGLALGARSDARLVRGNDTDNQGQTAVTAEFVLGPASPVPALLREQDLAGPDAGENLILRRTLAADGRSRAFVNDQPVSAAVLRRIGDALVEIEGRYASQGLMDPENHRAVLDAHGGLEDSAGLVAGLHRTWRAADGDYVAALEASQRSRAEEDYLRYVSAELAALNSQAGEEKILEETRTVLMNGERLIEAVAGATEVLSGDAGAEARLGAARQALARQGDKAGGRFDIAIAALDRAMDAAAEAGTSLSAGVADMEPDPERLEAMEERLFALRAAARKHDVEVDALPGLRVDFEARLAAIDTSDDALAELARKRDRARDAFALEASRLSKRRTKAAAALDKAVARELPPLKLEKARFTTVITARGEDAWTEAGIDDIAFEVATNPGTKQGPLGRIASAGELARFLLVLKVVTQRAGAVSTLVFDEVDSGIGGAAASAVGERLAQLGNKMQVLAVTHSPQVAAHGDQHLRVMKNDAKGGTVTVVDELSAPDRREEIARMLAGASVTEEARAAADSLISGGGV